MLSILKKWFGKKQTEALDRKRLGALGAKFACEYLHQNNYAIIEHNFRCPMGEIDIIAREGDTVVFVEVKSQYEHVQIRVEGKVDGRKQAKLQQLAQYYRRKRLSPETRCRIDVITVIITAENTPKQLRHHKRAI